ncbi:hypothetical protein BJY52DRAFT_357546 [Lactarius psammicola]|nr:hypothetical protein BJY52DRAFT_357546 [Lactarius psammicola]
MPALYPMDNYLGALFIGTVLSSIVYGVTWLQVYSYYNGHCSKDRWPLKSLVAFLMLVDSANLVFCVYPTYYMVVTNFGDYSATIFPPCKHFQKALALTTVILDVSVQHFYAFRIYHLGWRSPYLPAAISIVSLAEFGVGTVYGLKALTQPNEPVSHIVAIFIATLSCKVVCDVLITVGMVYTLLSNRTQVRRTNTVLNLLAIYTINCGILHLVFAISCVILFAKYLNGLIYTPSLLIMVRLSLCAFMSILNSRDNLRETLNGPGGVVVTFTQLNVRTPSTTVPLGAQDTTEASNNNNNSTAVPKGLPPDSVSLFSDSVPTA